jgi:hypothetical protein
MKVSKYRDIVFLMNQELLVSYQSLINDLSFSLGVFQVMLGKDNLTVDQKITEEASKQVSQIQSIVLPLLKGMKYNEPNFFEALSNASIYPVNLLTDINNVLGYQEESQNIDESLFDPYDNSLASFRDETKEFLYRLVSVYRLKFWLKDITEGLEQYGIKPYQVDETDGPNGVDILQGMDDLSFDDLLKELSHYLVVTLDDENDAQQDKTNLIAVITVIKKLVGGK